MKLFSLLVILFPSLSLAQLPSPGKYQGFVTIKDSLYTAKEPKEPCRLVIHYPSARQLSIEFFYPSFQSPRIISFDLKSADFYFIGSTTAIEQGSERITMSASRTEISVMDAFSVEGMKIFSSRYYGCTQTTQGEHKIL